MSANLKLCDVCDIATETGIECLDREPCGPCSRSCAICGTVKE